MANFVGLKTCRFLLRGAKQFKSQQAFVSTGAGKGNIKIGKFVLRKPGSLLICGTTFFLTMGATVKLQNYLEAMGLDLDPPHFPWSHRGWFESFDHASIRRGYQVYKQVCAACHSIELIHYRDMVDVCFSLEEAKKEAAEAIILDGPGDDGEMFQRPGKLTDVLPPPYQNKQAAMVANNGAYPPDLSVIALARHHEEDYIFSLLTGYTDPPPGMEKMEDLHYNPYFTGSWINMAQALYNEIIEYEDGTPASQSQLAKDVSTFLRWAAEPEFDQRKRLLSQFLPVMFVGAIFLVYYRRRVNISLRSRIVEVLDKTKK